MPAPAVSTSPDLPLTLIGPNLTGIAPRQLTAGASGFTLVCTGTGFTSSTVVLWNGAARATTFVAATQLNAVIPASDVAVTGTEPRLVTIGITGSSTTQTFTVLPITDVAATFTTGPGASVLGGTVTFSGTTDVGTTWELEYGASTSYGSLTAPDTLASSHSVPLTLGAGTYHYRVIATTAAGVETYSDDATFTVSLSAAIPAQPGSLTAFVQRDGSVLLTWADLAGNETSYKVLRRTGSAPFAVLAGASALPANTTAYVDTLVNPNSSYDYQVIASNAQGDSPPSTTASVTTSPSPQPPPPPTPDPNAIPSPIAVAGTPTYQYIDFAGTVHVLSDPETIGVLVGAKGLLMPAVSLIEQETPFLDGSRITGVRMPAREVDLPVLVQADTTAALRTALRQMTGWLDPHRGDGTLRLTAPDGTQRDLFCRYAGGLESATDDSTQAGPNWWVVALTLRAADPYFYATLPTTYSFSTAAPVPFFPIFPLHLSESSVISSARPNNTGDVEAWPIWTITGPATSVTLGNTTTGDSLTLNTALGVGDTIVIDTRPGRKSVVLTGAGGAQSNALGAITPTSSLWPLAIGFNDLNITMSSSGASSLIRLDFSARFLSA